MTKSTRFKDRFSSSLLSSVRLLPVFPNFRLIAITFDGLPFRRIVSSIYGKTEATSVAMLIHFELFMAKAIVGNIVPAPSSTVTIYSSGCWTPKVLI